MLCLRRWDFLCTHLMEEPTLKSCQHCGLPFIHLKHCPCGIAYCDWYCQYQDWQIHKYICWARDVREILIQWFEQGVSEGRVLAAQVMRYVKR